LAWFLPEPQGETIVSLRFSFMTGRRFLALELRREFLSVDAFAMVERIQAAVKPRTELEQLGGPDFAVGLKQA
jgi:hypothetical protein